MNRIRELREAAGMYQDELGALLNVGKGAISRYELEKRQLDPPTICALCDFFGCTADYLLGRSEVLSPAVSDADAQLLAAYHAAPDHVRAAIDTLLLPVAPATKEVS